MCNFEWTWANMQTHHLADGGILLEVPRFLGESLAAGYFSALLKECRWQQMPGIFGHPQPRLTAAYGDPGLVYRYSRAEHAALPWSGLLEEIRGQVEAVAQQFQVERFNYLLLNRYRSGSDSMGWHADDEPDMGPIIASLSLGATRNFRIRHTISRETRAFSLTSGSLLIMAGSMQQFWQHAVPKTKRPVGERINLTFRTLVAPAIGAGHARSRAGGK